MGCWCGVVPPGSRARCGDAIVRTATQHLDTRRCRAYVYHMAVHDSKGPPMPVTAKLSKSFYEAFGETVAAELVDWFNQVDDTYRADLRELNDLNFQRFDAKMGERLAEFETKMERRFAMVETKMDHRFADVETKMDQRFADFEMKMERRFAVVDRRFAETHATMNGGFSDIERRFGETDLKIEQGLSSLRDELLERLVGPEQLRAELSDKIGDVIKWMVVLWTGTMIAVITTGLLG